jgi:hypothetical protein
MVGGKMITSGEIVHGVPKADADNLVRRGKATVVDADESEEERELKDLSVADLKALAAEYEIEGAASMKKPELIEAIEAAEGEG